MNKFTHSIDCWIQNERIKLEHTIPCLLYFFEIQTYKHIYIHFWELKANKTQANWASWVFSLFFPPYWIYMYTSCAHKIHTSNTDDSKKFNKKTKGWKKKKTTATKAKRMDAYLSVLPAVVTNPEKKRKKSILFQGKHIYI